MAKFCASCGSGLGEDLKFCNKCGSAVQAATALSTAQNVAPAGAPSTFVTPNTMAGSPAATPGAGASVTVSPQNGGSALKIIMAIVGFLAVVSVLAIGSCFYIGYKVRQKARSIMINSRSANSGTSEMQLSDGGAGSKAAAAATIDVPPFPGSEPTATGGQFSTGLTGSASAQEYETDDSVDKVKSFYAERLGSKISIIEVQGNATFNYLTASGMTTVTITRDEGSGKTKINIARIGK